MARVCLGRRSDQLWAAPYQHLSRDGPLHWKGSQRRETGRSAGAATDKIRNGRESQNRQGARPDDPAVGPWPCGRDDRMKRRELFLFLAGAMISARPIHAQQKAMPVIGFLNGGSADKFAPYFAAFRSGLAAMGYIDGQNVA